MDTATPAPIASGPALDPAEATFDIVARQDKAEAEIAALRSDVDEVKGRIDRAARAAQRPAIGGAIGGTSHKSFSPQASSTMPIIPAMSAASPALRPEEEPSKVTESSFINQPSGTRGRLEHQKVGS